jgi:hypothetical protein
MTRKSIGSWSGLGLLVVVACTGGGAPNDFSAPEDDVPLAPGAPRDPNAPPASTTEPPFGGVAPQPPGDQPPSGGTSNGGTGGMSGNGGNGGTDGGRNCTMLCNDLAQACQAAGDAASIAPCVADCDEVSGRCFPLLQAFYQCGIESGCVFEACAEQAQDLDDCIGP